MELFQEEGIHKIRKKMYRINKIGNKFKFKNGIFFKTIHHHN